MTQWTVVIDWIDGDVEDSDEMSVFAKNPADAVVSAVRQWAVDTKSKWPSCHLQAAYVSAPP